MSRQSDAELQAVICSYCQQPAQLVGGDVIYPHRPDLYALRFYQCEPCDAWVGCHRETAKPLGRLANAELRQAKQDAHAAFDPLWQSGRMKRKDAYSWLASRLGIETAHIGEFDVETCRRVVEICQKETADVAT